MRGRVMTNMSARRACSSIMIGPIHVRKKSKKYKKLRVARLNVCPRRQLLSINWLLAFSVFSKERRDVLYVWRMFTVELSTCGGGVKLRQKYRFFVWYSSKVLKFYRSARLKKYFYSHLCSLIVRTHFFVAVYHSKISFVVHLSPKRCCTKNISHFSSNFKFQFFRRKCIIFHRHKRMSHETILCRHPPGSRFFHFLLIYQDLN